MVLQIHSKSKTGIHDISGMEPKVCSANTDSRHSGDVQDPYPTPPQQTLHPPHHQSLRSSFESNFYLKLVTSASNTLLLAAQVYVPYRAISRTGLNPALAAWARALLTTLDSNDQSLTHPYFSVDVVLSLKFMFIFWIFLSQIGFQCHL